MKTPKESPFFDEYFPALNQFILELVMEYYAGKINFWDELDNRVKLFFTPEMMNAMESKIPGWKKMASYSEGITLTHVMCVFLGLYMLPEFKGLSKKQQQLAQWIVLFHDIEKETYNGKRDLTHGFRSAVCAAQILPRLGFETTEEYKGLINSWSDFTKSAFIKPDATLDEIQDNQKLPDILDGINRLFGKHTPTSLIVRGVLLHMSLTVVTDWPQAAPLTENEIGLYLNRDLMPLLQVMNLADCEGWSMFYPEARIQQRYETLKVFEELTSII